METALTWLSAIGAFVFIVVTLARWITSPKRIAKLDRRVPLEQNAELLVGRYGKRNPERALVLGVVEGSQRRINACGNDQTGRAADGGTIFELGSVTKVFTGALLADALVRGEVKLETTIGDLLPDVSLSGPAREITLRSLATHTSGLPRLPSDLSDGEDKDDPYAHYTRERLLASLEGVEHSPAEWSEYSNYGVGLLGELLAIRAGTDLPALMRERISQPLGLATASFRAEGTPEPERLIDGVMFGNPTPHWTMPALAGAGGLRMSMDDLLRFLAFWSAPTGTWLAVRDLMWETQVDGPSGGVSLCWHIEGTDDDPIYWHNGSTYGASSYIAIRPAANRMVASLQNRSELFGSMVGHRHTAEAIGRNLVEY